MPASRGLLYSVLTYLAGAQHENHLFNMLSSSQKLLGRSGQRLTRQWQSATGRRAYSDTTTPPPLLSKLRNNLKSAMRAKDTNRLNVLKSLLADVTNASKTNNPVQTDMQLLSLLRKRSTAARAAGAEFKAAGRSDLLEREEDQAAILDEYAGGVETMSAEDITKAVKDLVLTLRSETSNLKGGDVLKALFKEGGILDGKPVDKKLVPGIVKQVLAS